MKTSELISNLQRTLESSGDLSVVIQDLDNELGTPVAGVVMKLPCGHTLLVLSTAMQLKAIDRGELEYVAHSHSHSDVDLEQH